MFLFILMSLSFAKDVRESYLDILSSQTPTDWALYGYDKDGNLKLLESGSDGLEGLIAEFNAGSILYAFARVIEPISDLSKFVLISWVSYL